MNYEKAFGKINRYQLFKIMMKRGFLKWLTPFNIVANLYLVIKTVVNTGKSITSEGSNKSE